MSHKFHFSKDSRERLEGFTIGEEPRAFDPAELPKEESDPQPKAAKKEKRPRKEKPLRKGKAEDSQPQGTDAPQENPLSGRLHGIEAAARTDIGRVRRTNQDALIEAPADGLWGVADGMGGHNGGETASAGAREGMLELLCGKTPEQNALRTAIGAVNRRLYLQQQEDASLSGMGTTLTALWFDKDCVHIGHVGDSRAYRLREGELEQITNDHSVVAELVRSGMLTKEQAAAHPMRNVITRAVGTEEGIEIDLDERNRQAGDIWLVCSDGLYGMVDDETICQTLKENAPDKAADRLVHLALENGGRDNVSVVVLLDKEGQA